MPYIRTRTVAHALDNRWLHRRQSSSSSNGTASGSGSGSGGSPPTTGAIVSIAIAGAVVVVFLVLLSISIYRKRARAQQPGTSTTTTSTSKRSFFGRWRSNSNRGAYSSQLQPVATNQSGSSRDQLTRERSADVEMEIARNSERTATTVPPAVARDLTVGVDRNTSVRSVMTLPPYSPAARPTEQVLGREGERAGIDVVVEQPETVDEQEGRRDDEMESLYQIRQARRQEAQDREERRRLRREARSRGDTATLARLQQESRTRQEAATAGASLSAQLIAEHQGKNRDRRVSSVQYFDVGVARHDGTRIRAASFESDNRPLLDSAASISENPQTPGEPRRSYAQSSRYRQSSTSVNSVSSAESASPGTDFEIISLNDRSRSHSQSRAQSIDTRSQHTTAATDEPPTYDHLAWGEAPPYESPVVERGAAPQLPGIASLPAIEVTEALTRRQGTPEGHPSSRS